MLYTISITALQTDLATDPHTFSSGKGHWQPGTVTTAVVPRQQL